MAQITQEITVEVAKPNLFQALVAKQSDCNSRFLKVTLADNGKKIEINPTSTTRINAKRPDGQTGAFEGVSNEDSTVTVPLAAWILELAGVVNCDISIIDTEGRKLTSTSFTVKVEEAACSDDEIQSDGKYDILTTLAEKLEGGTEIIQACEQATAAANEAVQAIAEPLKAINITYDNTASGLTATNVNAAIDQAISRSKANADAITAQTETLAAQAENITAQAERISRGDANIQEIQNRLYTPNILDNWYMANPINQRGETTYAGECGYMLDRWKQYGAAGTTTLETGYIRLSNSGTSTSGIYQIIENERLINGETYTFSCLANATTEAWVLSWCNDSAGTIKGNFAITGHINTWWLYTLTFTAEEAEQYSLRLRCEQAAGTISVKAFKLERGAKSTLAYLGGDSKYHLMDSPPKVADELLRCQRYYYRNEKLYITGFLSSGSTQYLFPVTLPIAMRACPEIVGSMTWRGRIATGGYSAYTGTGFVEFTNASISDFNGDTLTLNEILSTSGGDINNSIMSFDLRNLELSAEL